ncbi:unnamed protein product [Somion occarium]|uniref:Protein kinase domain-containing protein n=1 Tax=Somion occarium TaxID=3059160 RepID=A0ABP1ECT6_9APHY
MSASNHPPLAVGSHRHSQIQRQGDASASTSNTLSSAAAAARREREHVLETSTIKHRSKTDEGRWINTYLIKKQLGKGQHGDVYLAYDHRDPEHPQPVAVKQMRRKNKQDKYNNLRRSPLPSSPHTGLADHVSATEYKIRKEIAIMKKINHPHVVRLLEVIDDRMDERIYMVMEYLGGGEIKWRTTDNEPALRVDQVRRICRDVILGLEYLHKQGIIHRDIKPANLLWTEDRRMVKIADFGVSHYSYALHSSHDGTIPPEEDPLLKDDSGLTRFAGTPMFLAPEIVEGNIGSTGDGVNGADGAESSSTLNQQPPATTSLPQLPSPSESGTVTPAPPRKSNITKAIDVWAFGVTLYGLLFGKMPFMVEGGTEFQIYHAIRNLDWNVPETMGSDRIPVGGRRQRKPRKGEETEGYLVVDLLEKLLEKDANKRITLEGIKKHPWILRDMSEADAQNWVSGTRKEEPGARTPTEDETRGAVTKIIFSYIEKGKRIFRLLRPPRPNPSAASRRMNSPRRSRSRKGKEVGVQSAPSMGLHRHRSSAEVIARERQKKDRLLRAQVSKAQLRKVQTPPPIDIGTSSSRSIATTKSAKSSTTQGSQFEAFPMWNDGGSRKNRRGSVTSRGTLDSFLTAGSASSSQVPSPISYDVSPQSTPIEERPRSRASISSMFSWLRLNRSSTFFGPSPQGAESEAEAEASSATLPVPVSNSSPFRHSHDVRHSISLSQRRSADVFGGGGVGNGRAYSRQSSGSDGLALAVRASSWGEFEEYARPSEDHTSLYSEGVDNETYLVGAGGVARSPVSSLPTSGALSRVSSSISLGPSALSAAQMLLHRSDREGGDLPSAPDPASQDPSILQRQGQYRSPGHSSVTSPLSRPLYSRGDSGYSDQQSLAYPSVFDEDDEGSSLNHSGQETPLETAFQPSTSQLYQEEDEESSDDSEENFPLEVKTRRPSVTMSEASSPPPRRRRSESRSTMAPPAPPPRMSSERSERSERTVVCS